MVGEDEVNGARWRRGRVRGGVAEGVTRPREGKEGGRERDATEVPASSGIASRAGFPHQVA